MNSDFLNEDQCVSRLRHNLVRPLLLALTICCAAGLSCGVLRPSVHYILPDGYSGMFKIILDERNGVDLRLERGSYTLEIPPDGILRIKSFKLFDPWHEETASYKNGRPMPVSGSKVADNAVALREVGTHQRVGGLFVMTVVIGTKAQEDIVRKDELEQWFDDLAPAEYNQRLRAP